MSNGGGSTQTVTEKADPWSGVQPYMTDIFNKAKGLADQGGQYYGFNTVVPFTQQTEAALTGIENEAVRQLGSTNQSKAMAQKTLGSDYMGGSDAMKAFTDGSRSTGLDPLKKYTTGAGDVSGVSGYGGTGTPANDYLSSMASGEQIGANPYADAMFDKIQDRIEGSVGAQFGRSGMFGSTNYANELGDAVGDAASDFYGNIYNADRDRQLNAAGQVQSAYDNARSRGLSADQFNSDVSANNMARRYQAEGDMLANQNLNTDRMFDAARTIESSDQAERDRQLQTMFGAGQIDAQAYAPYEQLMNVGQIREEQGGRYLEDAMRRHDFMQNQPWQDLQNYSSVIGGYSNIGGTNTTSSPLYRNRAAGAIGGGLGGASIGSMFGPVGAGIGGALGLLGGLF